MKTKEMMLKEIIMEIFFILVPILGLAVAIFAMLLSGSNPEIEYVGLAGLTCLIFPFFTLEFFMPARILDDKFKIDTNVPFWGKVAFYLFLFPFCSVFMVLSMNTFFNFLPKVVRGEMNPDLLIISAIAYGVMVGSGLIYKRLKKTEKK